MPRTTIVTHPDGTVSKRTSQNRVYTHAVERAVDIAKKAESCEHRAQRADEWIEAIGRMIALGETEKLQRVKAGYSVANGWSYSSQIPGFEDVPGFWLPDHTKPAEWAQYIDRAIARVRETRDAALAEADALRVELMTKTHRYSVTAWCSRADLAAKQCGKHLPTYATNRVVEAKELVK